MKSVPQSNQLSHGDFCHFVSLTLASVQCSDGGAFQANGSVGVFLGIDPLDAILIRLPRRGPCEWIIWGVNLKRRKPASTGNQPDGGNTSGEYAVTSMASCIPSLLNPLWGILAVALP